MKKVIDILDSIQEVHCTQYANEKIDEAINELKELENRSCSNCKHSLALHSNRNIINLEIVCKIDSRYNYKDFYCNRWENKA